MGFRPEARTVRLVFEDPDLEGLEVLTRSVPFGAFLRIARLAQLSARPATAEDVNALDELFRQFADDALISWNLEDTHGNPVPPTYEGLQLQETSFVLQVVFAWLGAIGGAQGPLGVNSNNGSTLASPNLSRSS